jgi:hypothetical protein
MVPLLNWLGGGSNPSQPAEGHGYNLGIKTRYMTNQSNIGGYAKLLLYVHW